MRHLYRSLFSMKLDYGYIVYHDRYVNMRLVVRRFQLCVNKLQQYQGSDRQTLHAYLPGYRHLVSSTPLSQVGIHLCNILHLWELFISHLKYAKKEG